MKNTLQRILKATLNIYHLAKLNGDKEKHILQL
jgi:hypothetical protein